MYSYPPPAPYCISAGHPAYEIFVSLKRGVDSRLVSSKRGLLYVCRTCVGYYGVIVKRNRPYSSVYPLSPFHVVLIDPPSALFSVALMLSHPSI